MNLEHLKQLYAKATPLTLHTDDPTITFAMELAKAFPQIVKQIEAGHALAEAVEKSQEYDHDMLEHGYRIVAEALATYRESIK